MKNVGLDFMAKDFMESIQETFATLQAKMIDMIKGRRKSTLHKIEDLTAKWDGLKEKVQILKVRNTEPKDSEEERLKQAELFKEQNRIMCAVTILWMQGGVSTEDFVKH